MQQVFLVARIHLLSPALLTRFELWKSDERNTPRVGRHATRRVCAASLSCCTYPSVFARPIDAGRSMEVRRAQHTARWTPRQTIRGTSCARCVARVRLSAFDGQIRWNTPTDWESIYKRLAAHTLPHTPRVGRHAKPYRHGLRTVCCASQVIGV